MRRFLGLFVVVALVGLGYYFRMDIAGLLIGEGTSEAQPTLTASVCADLVVPPAPATLNLGVVLDPTTSTAASFTRNVVAALVTQLGNFLPDKPQPATGSPAIDGINLRIKQVGANPFAYGAPDTYLQIPGVRGLPPRPGVECLDSGIYQQWSALEKQWSTEYAAAMATRDKAISALRGMKLTDSNSGIRAALSALAVAMPGTEHSAYLVASDFEENVKPQTAGSLAGHPLILITACPSGNASECMANVESFGTWAVDNLDAPAPQLFRPENTTTAIARLFEEAQQ